jgi:hypothetical protein
MYGSTWWRIEDALERPSATLREDMTRDELEKFHFGEIRARGYGAVPMAVKQSHENRPE